MLSTYTSARENLAKHTHQQSYCTVCINYGVTIWRRCAILQDRHHCMLSAAKAAIWQVSCTLSTCTSPPFHSPPLLSPPSASLSLSLTLSLCLVLSLLVFLTPAIFPTFCSPLYPRIIPFLHLYLPKHPPPSRPESHTETRGSVKIEWRDEVEKE